MYTLSAQGAHEPHIASSISGFLSNPFQHLEASADPNLARYLVNLPDIEAVLSDSPLVVCAPPGAGKTALRLATTQILWRGYGTQHSFPVPYLLTSPTDPTRHSEHIAQATARSLLIALAYQPELLALTDTTDQNRIAAFLSIGLPRPLRFYAALLDNDTPISTLSRQLDHRYLLPIRHPKPELTELRDLLLKIPSAVPAIDPITFSQEIICGIFRFPSISVHVDGLDADGYENRSADRQFQLIEWLLGQVDRLARQQIILKVFAADQLDSFVRLTGLPYVAIQWTAELLAEVLRRRIAIATNGAFDSFNAIAARNLPNIERWIVAQVPALPRAVIELAGYVYAILEAPADQWQGLTFADLEQAKQQYFHATLPFSAFSSASAG